MTEDRFLPAEGAGREELRQLYNWTVEEAIEAQEEWRKADLGRFAVGPLFRWVAAQELLKIGQLYEKEKNPAFILRALFLCSFRSLPIPEWCEHAFVTSVRKVTRYKAKSWDDVFGKPHPKSTNLFAKRQRLEKAPLVYDRIRKIKRESPETPIDGFLFEKVGREFGIGGKTTTEEFYKEGKELVEMWKKFKR
ncbi:MAG: hypothetical protein WCZ16_00710 [Desulfosarcinaceae bacterium]